MNIYRDLQDAIVAVLVDGGVEGVSQIDPQGRYNQTSLNTTGLAVMVTYPEMTVDEARTATADVGVDVKANPEIADEQDGYDLANQCHGILEALQLTDETWTPLWPTQLQEAGSEDGLVGWTFRLTTRTVLTSDRTP